MMNDKGTISMSAEEAKPMMASKSLDTSHGTQASATGSQPGNQIPIKQETLATDINVEEDTYAVEVSDDDDSSDEVLSKLRAKEALVDYLMRPKQVVRCEHYGAGVVKRKYTMMEVKIKRQEDAPASKKMKCEAAAPVEQEMKPGDVAAVKEETKYQEDVLVEKKDIKRDEGAVAKEEQE